MGWLWWGDSTCPTQPGVRLELHGVVYKVERSTKTQHRLFSQGSRDTAEKWVAKRQVCTSMRIDKWYMVLSLGHVMKSPRHWGEEPEGRQCLVPDTRFSPTGVRTLIGSELEDITLAAFSPSTRMGIKEASAAAFVSDDA